MSRLSNAVLATIAALALTGCAYDYAQRTDRVGLGAGNAVRANIERETADPSKASMNDVGGLGGNGHVIPQNP